MSEKCSYFDCDGDICDDDKKYTGSSMRFCKKHSDEINEYIDKRNVKKVISFWIKANGGAERLARTF